jgi:hypothetical protein
VGPSRSSTNAHPAKSQWLGAAFCNPLVVRVNAISVQTKGPGLSVPGPVDGCPSHAPGWTPARLHRWRNGVNRTKSNYTVALRVNAIEISRRVQAESALMFTTILAYVTAIAGLVMIAAGAWDGSNLMSERDRREIPRRYYGFAIGMIGTGIGLVGIAQALRLLLVINGKM